CFKQKTAYEVLSLLEFRRVLFRSIGVNPPAYTIGNWHLLVGTYDGVSRRVYVDGAAVGLSSVVGSSSGATVSQIDMGIINENTAYTLPGTLDEVRFSSVARPASWMATEYKNQSAP